MLVESVGVIMFCILYVGVVCPDCFYCNLICMVHYFLLGEFMPVCLTRENHFATRFNLIYHQANSTMNWDILFLHVNTSCIVSMQGKENWNLQFNHKDKEYNFI